MKNSWKRVWLGGLVLGISAVTLAGCGNKSSDQSTSSEASSSKVKGDVKLWVDTDHIAAIKGQVAKFEKANPDVNVKVKAGSSADALKDVSKDPDKAADVFMMPHDQIGQMAEAGLLYPIGKKQVTTIKKNNVDSAVQGVTWKNKVYGYPYGIESQVLYYNKSKLSANDVKTWDGLTKAGKLGTNFAENGTNYIFAPLFMSNGDVLYGQNGENLDGTNFNNQKGVEVLSWIAKQKSNPGVVQTNAAALANLQSGKIDAFLSGPWSKNDVKKALGDKMGVAAYPTVNFGSGDKQMKTFLGVKVYGVNQQTKSPLAAMALADYLSNEKTQEVEFNKNGVVPSNKQAQQTTKVKTDVVAKSVMEMSDTKHSVVMPKLPEMTTFWPPMDSLINDVYKGKIKSTQYQEKLDKFVTDNAKKTK
ncbi:extracellular solute-binding protein [Latilactobacillus fuchuensis]|uniref:extracellular solute-binding protein n=1 Tax=Latilactobacillus fuchuensis TaxID=164393 RepID=UPI0020C77A35|nr:extracellular solute-binding protein [Latilactobacillus fuchuensis]MCP8857982.1 extracellular solute-binding protein [Latilactobacillus fuchuensis]